MNFLKFIIFVQAIGLLVGLVCSFFIDVTLQKVITVQAIILACALVSPIASFLLVKWLD